MGILNTCPEPLHFKVINEIAYDLQYLTGHVRHAILADSQLLMHAEYIVNILPNIRAFGLACMYIYDPSLMPDLKRQDNDPSDVQKL